MSQTQTRKQKILKDAKSARKRRALISTLIVVVLAVGIVAGIILLTPKTPCSYCSLDETPVSTVVFNQLTGVTDTTLSQVGSGPVSDGTVTPLTTVGGSPLISGGKNEFLYVGAEYCPYCAAERWGMIVALSKFGNFTGLTYMTSLSSDVFGNTATFSFLHATYQSQYNITFVSVETEDQNRNPLQKVNSQEQSLLNQWDSGGGIPFIDIGGSYVIQAPSSSPGTYSGGQYSPGIIGGLNWTQIGSQLNNPTTAVAQAIDGTANTIIKAICAVDGNNPSGLCGLTLARPTQAPLASNNQVPPSLSNLISTDDSSGYLTWRSSQRLI
jgi:hypothetical protein